MTREPPIVVVLSEPDPVARAIAAAWAHAPSTGAHVDGTAIREVAPGVLALHRPGPHLQDDHLEQHLPSPLRAQGPTLVFASIHRSDSGVRCLTVHPLGNPGAAADLGGRPRRLVPTDPARMTGVLRSLAEGAGALGRPVTFEATHHGPEVGLPAFFAEIAVPEGGRPEPGEVRLLAEAIRSPLPGADDRVAVGAGGGHYAPHFTDLALRRRWSFGHLLSRHALVGLDRPTAQQAVETTPRAAGVLFARAQDRGVPAFAGWAPVLRDGDADPRGGPPATSPDRPTSGT